MSNGLEREFPEVAWRAVPPIGPSGLPPEVVRGYVARGRELHSRAVRNSVRFGFGAIARALLAVLMICRRGARDASKRPSKRDPWAASAPGA